MKAIDIMWLKKYLDTPDKRPTWCWVADALIKGDAYLHSTPRVEESARLNWALQTWRTRQGKHSKLPKDEFSQMYELKGIWTCKYTDAVVILSL